MESSADEPKSGVATPSSSVTCTTSRRPAAEGRSPGGGGRGGARRGGTRGPGGGVGAPADEPDQRHPDEAEDDERGPRVAGQADYRHAVALGEERGLAGSDREPVAPDAGLAE